MKSRVLATCDGCGRVGYDHRHAVLTVGGLVVLDRELCKACAAEVEHAAKTAAGS